MAKANAPARRAGTITERLVSLDAFRGFDILTMVFVNWCAGISGIPGWMKHMPSDVDGMTFVDLVFPAFLFIMGAAIPLAIEARRSRGESVAMILAHMVRRVAGLVLLGVVFVNLDNYNAAATGLSHAAWTLLFFTGAIVLWCAPPRNAMAARIHRYLRVVAVVGMGVLLFMFRRNAPEGATEWLKPEWWGILGLLGWSYLGCSVAYLVTRGNRAALMGGMALMLAVYIGDRHGSMPAVLGILDQRFGVGIGTIFGSTAAITMAGVIVGTLFTAAAKETHRSRLMFMLWFGVALYAAGQLIRPLHGISKDNGTDAYALVTAGESCLMLALFYLTMDVWKIRAWGAWLLPVGINPLLAYILPDIFSSAVDLTHTWEFFWRWNTGWPGVGNAAVITLILFAVAAGLTRLRVLMKL